MTPRRAPLPWQRHLAAARRALNGAVKETYFVDLSRWDDWMRESVAEDTAQMRRLLDELQRVADSARRGSE